MVLRIVLLILRPNNLDLFPALYCLFMNHFLNKETNVKCYHQEPVPEHLLAFYSRYSLKNSATFRGVWSGLTDLNVIQQRSCRTALLKTIK